MRIADEFKNDLYKDCDYERDLLEYQILDCTILNVVYICIELLLATELDSKEMKPRKVHFGVTTRSMANKMQ